MPSKNLQPLSNRLEPARGSSLATVKTQQLAREEEEKSRHKRIKGAIVLVQQFLLDQGYMQALQALQSESHISAAQWTAADNIDLLSVITEFEQYYEMKHQRRPKLFRARDADDAGKPIVVSESNGERMLVRKPHAAVSAAGAASPHSLSVLPTAAAAQTGSSTSLTSLPPAHLQSYGSLYSGEVRPQARSGTKRGSSSPDRSLSPPLLQPQPQSQQTSPAPVSSPLLSKGPPPLMPLRPAAAAGAAALQGSRKQASRGDSSNHRSASHPLSVEGQRVQLNGEGAGGGEDRSEQRQSHTFMVSAASSSGGGHSTDDDGASFVGRALKPLPFFPSHDLQELAGTILREIVDVNPNVRFDDIAELDQAKHLLKEAVVMPVKYPELFEGIVRPWKGILLFGPPGTGKTLLAKAVATECRTTFFSISASSVVSKWRGDSEKLVRMLFDLAVHYAPSTIFIDEIDSLMSSRSTEGEHEGSRRMKTELLTQMDGLAKRRGGEVVFVLAASNVPWDLDMAMLRRLEKRVLVGLPTAHARVWLFRKLMKDRMATAAAADTAAEDWAVAAAAMTEGMSGADIDIICREATMRPIRKLIDLLEAHGNANAPELTASKLKRPMVSLDDLRASVACTRSSVRDADLARYTKWAEVYGSGLST